MTSVKVTFHGNVLYSNTERTVAKNLRKALAALAYVLDIPIKEIETDPELRIEHYRSS